MKIYNHGQRTPEWYEARLGMPTASSFHKVISKGAPRSNYLTELLLERLTGIQQDSYTNEYMQWGTDNEPAARLAYEFATGWKVQEVGLAVDHELNAGASSDGLASEGLAEFKCPTSANHIEVWLKDKMPAKHKPQVQGQMLILDKPWVDFTSYDPRMPQELQLKIIRVYRDEDYIEMLRTEIIKFNKDLDDMYTKLLARTKIDI